MRLKSLSEFPPVENTEFPLTKSNYNTRLLTQRKRGFIRNPTHLIQSASLLR